AVMKVLPDEIGRGVWGGNLFAWKFNSRLNRITGGNKSDKLEIAKGMGDLVRILMSFEGTYHDFFEVLKEMNDKGRHFDTDGLVERYRTLILGLLNISDTAKQALRNIDVAQRIAKSVESQVAGEKIFQVPIQPMPDWFKEELQVIFDVSLRITLVSLVEEIMYKQQPGKDFQVLVKALYMIGSDLYYGPGGRAIPVYIFSPNVEIIWPQANQVIEEDVKGRGSRDDAGVKADILPPVLPVIPEEDIDRVVAMVKEYDALSETGERELRLFLARKIKEISYKTFLEDRKDVSDVRARHIVVSAWLAAKHHLSALGMRGLFGYFEDGTTRNFYDFGLMRADSGGRRSMQEAGEILVEGDRLLGTEFASVSSPVGENTAASETQEDRMVPYSQMPASLSSVKKQDRDSLGEGGVIITSPYDEIVDNTPVPGSSPKKKNFGGIDLNPALLDLQIKRDGNGVPLPLPMQPIENMHIDGFLPVIINIVPITNLPLLLGLDFPPQEEKPVQVTYQELSLAVTPARERFYVREPEATLI
ncbi:MAG: hypothetical protein AABY41_03465, partial [Nitrospirota bacterium]